MDLPDNGIRNHPGTERKLAEPFSFLVGSVLVGPAVFAVVAVRLGFEVDGAVAADRTGRERFFYRDEFRFEKGIFLESSIFADITYLRIVVARVPELGGCHRGSGWPFEGR